MLKQIARPDHVTNLRRMLVDDSGQGLVEYALIITFTALVCMAALRSLGNHASNSLNNAANSLS
jgi:Flp pilus assembly pilin Flp